MHCALRWTLVGFVSCKGLARDLKEPSRVAMPKIY